MNSRTITAFAVAWLVIASYSEKGRGDVTIFPSGPTPYGLTTQEFATAWWQWIFSAPIAMHPAFDDPAVPETALYSYTHNNGPAFFLVARLAPLEPGGDYPSRQPHLHHCRGNTFVFPNFECGE